MDATFRDELLEMHLALGLPCSCGCGRPLTRPEVHHGIVTKARARGVKGNWIDHKYNCFLVNHDCHQRIPGPQHFWEVACERWGRENVQEWYDGVQGLFKSELEGYDRTD